MCSPPRPYFLIPKWGGRKHLEVALMPERRFQQEGIAHSVTFLKARGVPFPGELALLDSGAIEVTDEAAPIMGPSGPFGGWPAHR